MLIVVEGVVGAGREGFCEFQKHLTCVRVKNERDLASPLIVISYLLTKIGDIAGERIERPSVGSLGARVTVPECVAQFFPNFIIGLIPARLSPFRKQLFFYSRDEGT